MATEQLYSVVDYMHLPQPPSYDHVRELCKVGTQGAHLLLHRTVSWSQPCECYRQRERAVNIGRGKAFHVTQLLRVLADSKSYTTKVFSVHSTFTSSRRRHTPLHSLKLHLQLHLPRPKKQSRSSPICKRQKPSPRRARENPRWDFITQIVCGICVDCCWPPFILLLNTI